MNASKERFGAEDLSALFEGATKLLVAKAKKVTTIDLKQEAPSAADLAALVLGPTGNLRAPALRVGKTWYVGFHPETYAEAFGG